MTEPPDEDEDGFLGRFIRGERLDALLADTASTDEQPKEQQR